MQLDNTLFDTLLAEAAESPRLRQNFDLRNFPEDLSQRILNALQPGTVVPVHRHTKTSETFVLLRGKMEEIFYEVSNEGVWDGDSHCVDLCRKQIVRETGRVLLEAGSDVQGMNIPIGQWHSINVLEPTIILECKDGKYEPLAEEDIINL